MTQARRLILCGEMAKHRSRADALRMDINARGGDAHRLIVGLDNITGTMVQQIRPRLLDLLEVAAYVFSADQYIRREGDTMRGMGADWRRLLDFRIPVRDPDFWSGIGGSLSEVLSFLSDDEFRFSFERMAQVPATQPFFDLQGSGPQAGFTPDTVMLFSGGLDSLAGAVELLSRGRRVALVSHQSAPFVVSRQEALLEELRSRFPKGRLFHVGVRVGKQHQGTVEHTQRTRSFLFASLAAVVVDLFQLLKVTFCENGVTSINLPLATHVLGARATRTTHPRVLAGFSELFSQATDREVRVENRYFWKTKAEVLTLLREYGQEDLAAMSVSCTRTMQMTKAAGGHCGTCSQCLDRFFTMRAAGLDAHDAPYQVDVLRGERSPGKDLVLAESYVLTALRWARLPLSHFGTAHGELFRLLPWLEAPAAEALYRLAGVLQRHGNDVRGVLERASAAAGLDDAVFGDAHSLLNLTRSVSALDTPQEASAEQRPMPIIPRPLSFAVEEDGSFNVAGLRLSKAHSELLAVLYKPWHLDFDKKKSKSEFSSTKAAVLADSLGVDEIAVRKRVSKIRQRFSAHCSEKYGVEPQQSDLIEAVGWKGYRLSPYLARTLPEALSCAPRSR